MSCHSGQVPSWSCIGFCSVLTPKDLSSLLVSVPFSLFIGDLLGHLIPQPINIRPVSTPKMLITDLFVLGLYFAK